MEANDPKFGVSRREFIQVSSMGGVWLITRNLTGFASLAPKNDGNPGWSGPPGKARYRIEGMAKVLGKKIYARDFRARDMDNWPAQENVAMVLRTNVVGHVLTSIDLSMLPANLQPLRMVTATDLANDGLTFPGSDLPPNSKTGGLFAAIGTAPQFLGQPVAVLLFKDYRTYIAAHRLLQFNPAVLKFGFGPEELAIAPQVAPPINLPRLAFKVTDDEEEKPELYHLKTFPVQGNLPSQPPFYLPPTFLTRYADSTGEKFSQVLNGVTNPDGDSPGDKQAAQWRQTIATEMQSSGWTIFDGLYITQQLDPMFMEPESGLGWLDPSSQTLHFVIGTQSSNGCVADSITMFGSPSSKFKVSTVVLNACYPGGGFGGRDVSTFPTMLAIAAAYSDKPVRMAYDRYEQFQSGLKQLGASISQQLAVDSNGRFQAIIAQYNLLAGGRNNYSQWIAELAGYCGSGGYVIPRVAIDAKARASNGVIAGSMRGFGGPQAAFAVESMIDEVALKLNTDPILLRERNALAQGGFTATGYQVAQSLRIAEICKRAQAHPLWVQKEKVRQTYLANGFAGYGVGFALANQAFGTGNDGVMAAVDIDLDGTIGVTTNCVDMGNGSATSLAISTAALGANATRIRLGEVTLFSALKNVNYPSKDWSNPQYTAAGSMSSSACITAFHQVHVVQQASQALMLYSLWPAARKLWGFPANLAYENTKLSWEEGALVTSGKQPIRLKQLAQFLYGSNGSVAAMVHASFLGQWVQSTFPVGVAQWTAPIDALAFRYGGSESWKVINRFHVVPPPSSAWNNGRSLYAPSGTLAAVTVARNGTVKVIAIHSYLEAGTVIQPDLLMGQYYGGVAMGIGYAFYEDSVQTFGGPGEGEWNLNRYRVPMWSDLPLDQITLELLDPLTPGEPGRGIAEAVLCPVPPALSNAVGNAMGKRFRSLPITPKKILEAVS